MTVERREVEMMTCAQCGATKAWADGFPTRFYAVCWDCSWKDHWRSEHAPRLPRWFKRFRAAWKAAAASSVATPTPPGVTAFDGTAGTTATESEPAHAIGAQRGTGQTADDRALLAGGPPGPAVQSHTR